MVCLRVLQLLALLETLVRASYTMDDTDSRITYSGDCWSHDWDKTFSGLTYNSTSSVAQASTKDNCTMAIPFYGTGITLYAMVVYAFTFNISIDGYRPLSSNLTYHNDGVAGCCNSTHKPLSNYMVFTETSLMLNSHTLILRVLDSLSGYFQNSPGISAVYFDYAYIVSSSNDDPFLPSYKPSRSIIGPAIGGTIGGIILTGIFILFCMRARRRDTIVPDSDPNILVDPVGAPNHPPNSILDPNVLASNIDPTPVSSPNHLSNSDEIYPDANILGSNAPVVGAYHPSAKDTSHHRLPHPVEQSSQNFYSHTDPSNSPQPVSTLPSVRPTTTADDAIPGLSSDSALAAEEARFLRRLYTRNAPAEEIAELLQAMREREEANSGIGGQVRPPAYDASG